MRYMVERNFVQVIGTGWYGQQISTEIPLRAYDKENIGEFTRENVEAWLTTHAGDFQAVDDFRATYGDVDLEWADENSGPDYYGMMHPEEVDNV